VRALSAPNRLKHASPNGLRSVAKRSVRLYAQATSARRVLPDFLVIGTKRGGTTSLFNALLDHPQVSRMFPKAETLKSPHYFDLNAQRPPSWYRSFFPTARSLAKVSRQLGHPVVCGEASPYYLWHPLAAERASAVVPKAKIIVLLRDPVDRAYSHYWDRILNHTEQLSFPDAVAAEEGRLAGERERLIDDPTYQSPAFEHSSYLGRGHYLDQLLAWEKHFPPEQMLVMASEPLYRDPSTVFRRVLDFLGLEPQEFAYPHKNKTVGRESMDPVLRQELKDHFRPHNEALFRHLGEDYGWNS
jgi:hypothetical protein